MNTINTNIATFYSGKKEFNSLSNFWKCNITIYYNNNIRYYESGEHCFHGEKYFRLSELSSNIDRAQELLNYSKNFIKNSIYKTSSEAKQKGGKNGLLLNENELTIWNTLCINVQTEICKWKIENENEVFLDLLNTQNKILIHPALRCSDENIKSKFWEGRAKLNENNELIILGKNILGTIWMNIRDS